MRKQKSASFPSMMQEVYGEITAITDAFCREHLDEDYADLARLMAAALARKRPSPLARGRKDVWAAGIVYCLGTVNFLFDKSQTPHLTAEQLAGRLAVSQKTAANKARQIREIFDVVQADPRWWRPSQMEQNPLAWWVMVNGMVVDARKMSLEIQEDLVRRGLIPFVPGKRGRDGTSKNPESRPEADVQEGAKVGEEEQVEQNEPGEPEEREEREESEGSIPTGRRQIVHFKIERI